MINQDLLVLEELIQKIDTEFLLFQNCKEVKHLYSSFEKYIKEKIKSVPKFSFCVPEFRLPEHPRLEFFFKSNDQKFVYDGLIKQKAIDLKVYLDQYKKDFFSSEITVKKMINNKYSLDIEKTLEFFNNINTKYQKNVTLQRKIEEKINKFEI